MWAKKVTLAANINEYLRAKELFCLRLIILDTFYLHFTIFGAGYTIQMLTKKIVT